MLVYVRKFCEVADLYAQRDSFQLHTRLVEAINVLPRSGQVFSLDFGGIQLSFLGILFDTAL